MFLLRKPDATQIEDFLQAQSALEVAYPGVGTTRNTDHPAGFTIDQNQICLGSGRQTFEAAKQALQLWQHYRFSWIELHRPEAPPDSGQTVATVARALGLWVLNACRIVYVVEETEPLRRYTYAYGTLPEHAESGEERFQVTWKEDDSVWYEIFAFSRPNQLLARLGYPYVRHKQKQFARESMQSMKDALSGTAPE
ncbi:MAG: DUF1990 domain-containing protein [Fuerstiella sp.]